LVSILVVRCTTRARGHRTSRWSRSGVTYVSGTPCLAPTPRHRATLLFSYQRRLHALERIQDSPVSAQPVDTTGSAVSQSAEAKAVKLNVQGGLSHATRTKKAAGAPPGAFDTSETQWSVARGQWLRVACAGPVKPVSRRAKTGKSRGTPHGRAAGASYPARLPRIPTYA
jgi:hypothetical protein